MEIFGNYPYNDFIADQEKEIRQQQELDFKKLFLELDPDIPPVFLSGNHDVGDIPTKTCLDW